MSTSRTPTLPRILRVSTFDRLQMWLHDAACRVDADAFILTEQDLAQAVQAAQHDRFILVHSPHLFALLHGRRERDIPVLYRSILTFDFEQILRFLLKNTALKSIQKTEKAQKYQRLLTDLNHWLARDEPSNPKTEKTATKTPKAKAPAAKTPKSKTPDLTLSSDSSLGFTQFLPNTATNSAFLGQLILELVSNWELEAATVNTKNEPIAEQPDPGFLCQPIEEALSEQVEKERLLNDLTDLTHGSVALTEIISDMIERVRLFLRLDRLAIYQFDHYNHPPREDLPEGLPFEICGSITYEATHTGLPRLSEMPEVVTKLVNCDDEELTTSNFAVNYLDDSGVNLSNFGTSVEINTATNAETNIETHSRQKLADLWGDREEWDAWYDLGETERSFQNHQQLASPPTAVNRNLDQGVNQDKNQEPTDQTAVNRHQLKYELFKQAQVKAQLIIPILIRDRRWGILIAQQCLRSRTWRSRDRNFLRQVATQLSIAIYQAQLIAEVQQQKQMLEQQVNQRNQDLHSALLAAQVASQMRSEFLSMMSHELRTPLACVIGMSATLLRWSFGHLTDKQREYLQTIHSSGEHLLSLVNDLLDLADLESGKAVLNISEFSVSQLARQMIWMMEDRATINGVELKLKLEVPTALDLFQADRNRVSQILFNLLSNAIKFTPAGGKVHVNICRRQGQMILIIEDTGIGIPKHQQSVLFESFRQLEGTYTREYGGTGLGLALTKQLVDLHNGSITVESELEQGSQFTVRLPERSLLSQSNLASKNASIPPAIPHGHIVLITGRDEDATLICDILTAAGFQVVWMLNGSTALDQIRALRPILAIIDQRIDGIDGYDLSGILRELPELAELQTLMLLEEVTPSELQLCRDFGVDDYTLTPIQPEILLNKVLGLIAKTSDSVDQSS